MKYNELLFSAIGEIDEKYVAEAAIPRSRTRTFTRIGAIAAAFILTVGVTLFALLGGGGVFELFDANMSGGNAAGGSGGAGAPGTSDQNKPTATVKGEYGEAITFRHDDMGVIVKITFTKRNEGAYLKLLESEDSPAESGVSPTFLIDYEEADRFPEEEGSYIVYVELPEEKTYGALYVHGIGVLDISDN